jgi:quinol monooxygenase YgiN
MSSPFKLSKYVVCLSYFRAKPQYRDELIQALLNLIEPTRAEPGCLQYDLLLDKENPNFLIMAEKFDSQKALDDHEQQPYIKHFVEHFMSQYCEEVTWNTCNELTLT